MKKKLIAEKIMNLAIKADICLGAVLGHEDISAFYSNPDGSKSKNSNEWGLKWADFYIARADELVQLL